MVKRIFFGGSLHREVREVPAEADAYLVENSWTGSYSIEDGDYHVNDQGKNSEYYERINLWVNPKGEKADFYFNEVNYSLTAEDLRFYYDKNRSAG